VKKTLNVFGIIIAWLLSLAMVALLTVAPMTLSALDLLEPETIFEAVVDALDSDEPSAAAPKTEETYGITSLSSKNEKPDADQPLDDVDLSKIEDIIGEEVDEELVIKIVTSDAARELLKAYTDDVTNAIVGKSGKSQFTAEKLIEVVEENIDEIAEIVRQENPDLSAEDIKELKSEVKTVVRENADEIVKAVPAPADIRDDLVGSGEGGEIVASFLAMKNMAKLAFVGVIVLLSVLIFLCRIPGFRGLRWLSTNLFTAGGANIAACVFLNLGTSVVTGIVNVEELEFIKIGDVISNLLSAFTKGVTVRTIVMLAAAVVLLVAYILLKVFRRKKAAKQVAPVYAPVEPAYVPAEPVYTPAPVVENAVPAEAEPAAEACEEEPVPEEPAAEAGAESAPAEEEAQTEALS